MDGRSCVVCRKPVNLGDSIRHNCTHRTHSNCITDVNSINFEKCAACAGQVNLNAPLLPVEEPGSSSGIDYVEQPAPLVSGGITSVLFSNPILKRKAEIVKLLQKRIPIDCLMREHNIGLQTLLECNINIDTMLQCGYTWETDLKLFKDLDMKRSTIDRVQRALIAFGVDARHLLAIPSLNNDKIFSPKDQANMLQLHFPQDGNPLQCHNGKRAPIQWTCDDLLQLGWKADDLFYAGLQFREQYEDLQPTENSAAALHMTSGHFSKLQSYSTPTLMETSTTTTTVVTTATPTRQYIIPVETPSVTPIYFPRYGHGLKSKPPPK